MAGLGLRLRSFMIILREKEEREAGRGKEGAGEEGGHGVESED